MPNPRLQISVNGGPPQTGHVVANAGDSIALSTDRPGHCSAFLFEILAGPPGWSPGGAWTTGSDGVFSSTSPTPDAFTLSGTWGKVVMRFTPSGDASLSDESTLLEVVSPTGVHDLPPFETSQVDARLGWGLHLQEDLRLLEEARASLGLGPTVPRDSVVFKPGGTTGGNVYDTFAAAWTAVNAVPGPVSLAFDSSLGAVTIPDGTYDLAGRIALVGLAVGTRTAITMGTSGGAQFQNPRDVQNLSVAGGALASFAASSGKTLDTRFVDTIMTPTGAAPAIDAGSTAGGQVFLTAASGFGGSNTPLRSTSSGAGLKVYVGAGSNVPAHAVTGGGNVTLIQSAPDASISTSQNTGTNIYPAGVAATPMVFEFEVDGEYGLASPLPYQVGAEAVVISPAGAFYIDSVAVERDDAGGSGNTTIDVKINDTTIFDTGSHPKPTIAATDGDKYHVTSTSFVTVVAVGAASGSRLRVEATAVETTRLTSTGYGPSRLRVRIVAVPMLPP